jgi:proliferating cell nuclear antigen
MFKLYCDDDAKRLFMDYEGSGYTLSFNLTLFQFNSEKYHFPDIEYSATLEMPSSDFLLIPKIVGTFGEFISIDAKKETAEFMQEGDLVCASFTIDPSKDSTSIITVSEPVKITIPMKYVNVVAKIVGLSEKLKISMGDHAPALFEFGLDEDGYMKFYVALKINDSDE